MSTITASIAIHPDPGEDLGALVTEALRRLEGLGVSATTAKAEVGYSVLERSQVPDRTDSDIWPDDWCDRVVAGMTEGGLQALRFMCEHGPQVSFADMMRDQGLDPSSPDDRRVMGGRLSSFGHNLNRLPRRVRNPMRDATGETKWIDTTAMGPFLAALDRYTQASHPA